jgi:predicted AAA+ superfamily ATPase
MERTLNKVIRRDLERKMVLLAGPRQVGKTTLAQQLLPDPGGYLNWDVPEHRASILGRTYPVCPMLVFDEIHKFRRWRDYLKGFCDGVGRNYQTLVTGSARLDAYKHGGDSLQGRYHYHRMLPLTADELAIGNESDLNSLFRLGGFPEPFLSGSETEARRWTREYQHLLVNEEIASLERVVDLGTMQLLAMRLPDLVGSPLSLNALREDLHVSHKAVSRWVDIFERLYMIFRLPPFGAPTIRAVRKEQKHYFLDWNLIADDGARFENLLAVQLLKLVYRAQDELGLPWELRYFRDRDGREVDFIVCDRQRAILAVEGKLQDRPAGQAFGYLRKKFPELRAIQVALQGKRHTVSPEGVTCMPMLVFAHLDLLTELANAVAGAPDPMERRG